MRQIKGQDVAGWYGRLNAILAGHGLSGIAVPAISGTARAAQVTPLTDKLDSMKEDTYYKFADYSDWGQIVQGAVMRAQTPLGVEATLSSVEATIVCRNTSANNYGTCSYGYHANGSHSNGSRSNGYKSVTCSHGSNANGANSDGYNAKQCTNGSNSNGTYSQGTKANVYKSNGSWTAGVHAKDGNSKETCVNNADRNGTHANGSNSDGAKSYGTKSNGSHSDGVRSNGTKSNGTKSNATDSYGSNYNVLFASANLYMLTRVGGSLHLTGDLCAL